jgi:uncharacterized protein (TIGR03000 family)
MRALFSTILLVGAGLIVTATEASRAQAGWLLRSGGGSRYGYGRFGFGRAGWGGYRFYPGLGGYGYYGSSSYPYYGYPPYPYYAYPLYGYYPPANYASMSTAAGAPEPSHGTQETQLPHPAGDVLVPPANAGVIRLHLPDQFADVTFNDQAVSSIGTTRTYVTPDLEPGERARYDIKVSWLRGNQRASRETVVEVRPGQINTVYLAQGVTGSPR